MNLVILEPVEILLAFLDSVEFLMRGFMSDAWSILLASALNSPIFLPSSVDSLFLDSYTWY